MTNSADLVFRAIVEHHRWWYADDGVKRHMIVLNGGKIDPRVLRDIARAYSVSRGLFEDCEGEIARILNEAMASWPPGFLRRAGTCIRIAKRLNDDKLTRGRQISALTKLTWFMRPDGWTLYDDLAATGLGIHKYVDTVDRMKKYYRRLDEWGFPCRIPAMQTTINASETPELRAERILDKLLVFHGSGDEAREVIRNETDAYFGILDPETQSHLEALSALLAKEPAWGELDAIRTKS